MSVSHAIVGKLPPDDKDGLATVARSFADDPRSVVVVAIMSPKSIETEIEARETGERPRKVKFQIDWIEPVEGSDKQFVVSTLKAAHEMRTGIKQLDSFERAMVDGIDVGPTTPDEPDADENGEIQ